MSLHADVWASLCRITYVQSLTIEHCFTYSSDEMVQCAIYTSVMWKLEKIRKHHVSADKTFEMNKICTFIYSGFWRKEGGIDVFSFLWKNCTDYYSKHVVCYVVKHVWMGSLNSWMTKMCKSWCTKDGGLWRKQLNNFCEKQMRRQERRWGMAGELICYERGCLCLCHITHPPPLLSRLSLSYPLPPPPSLFPTLCSPPGVYPNVYLYHPAPVSPSNAARII